MLRWDFGIVPVPLVSKLPLGIPLLAKFHVGGAEPDEAQLRGNARSQVELGNEQASPQQPFPITADRRAQAEQGRHEDGDVARFDLLHGARVQVGEFGQPLLRQPARHPLAAEMVGGNLEHAQNE